MNIPDYRIASFCTSPAWGGLEMNVLRSMRWMQQRGWQVCLYSPAHTRMFTEAKRWNIPVQAVRQRLRKGDLAAAWRLSRLIRKQCVKRLIVHQSHDMFTAAVAKRLSPKDLRLVYSQHMHVGRNKKDLYHSWLHCSFDAWETPVQWLADRVREKSRIPAERIHVLARGQEMDKFTVLQPDRLAARQRYGLPSDAFVVGLIGRVDPKKCQDIVVQAIDRVRREGHDVRLLMIGDQTVGEGDEYTKYVRKLVKDLNLTDFVCSHPFEPEVEWAYAGLDVFVLASKSECYGMVTIEAMASGLPVIATRDGGTLSIIDHERNGLLVTPKDVDELTSAILQLIESPDFARKLAQTAREEAVVKYSHVRQCEQWEQLLTSL